MSTSEEAIRYHQVANTYRFIRSVRSLGEKAYWQAYGSGVNAYERILRLEEGSLHRLVEEKNKTTGSALMLDLFGEGQVLRELSPSAGLAVTINDERGVLLSQSDNLQHISLIPGNVFSKRIWRQMHTWFRDLPPQISNYKEEFDSILCLARGGVENLPYDTNLNFWLLQQMWSLLSPNEGKLAIQFSPYAYDYPEQYFLALSETPDISVHFFPQDANHAWPIVHITRGPSAPQKLPTFQ